MPLRRLRIPRSRKAARGRVPMPPPSEVMGDRRTKREADRIRAELDEQIDLIDEALEDEDCGCSD